jgi:hypothetical protein
VNRPETEAELEALGRSAQRGTPFGEATWVVETARALRLERTPRPPGRPPTTRRYGWLIGSRPLSGFLPTLALEQPERRTAIREPAAKAARGL